MHRFNSLFLNLIVVVGLALGTVPLGLSAAATSQSPPGTASSTSTAAAPALAGKHGKHKKKRNDRQQHRKHKDRKQDHQRKKQKNRQQEEPVELPTGELPGATTVDPDVDSGVISAKDHYIVLLKSDKDDALKTASDIAAGKPGVTPTFVYHNVFEGFAAVIPPISSMRCAMIRASRL